MRYREVRVAVAAFALLAMVGGCPSDDGSAPGTERGPCHADGTCDSGLVCLSGLCVRPGDAGADAVADADAEPDTEPDAVSDADAEPDTEPDAVSDADAEPDTEPDAVSDADAEPDTEPDADAEPDAEPDAAPDAPADTDSGPDIVRCYRDSDCGEDSCAQVGPASDLLCRQYRSSCDLSTSTCMTIRETDSMGLCDFSTGHCYLPPACELDRDCGLPSCRQIGPIGDAVCEQTEPFCSLESTGYSICRTRLTTSSGKICDAAAGLCRSA
ncbi:MAG: hypothetical protein JXB32_22970 [Deltaproteobacteria bacterium]|nr:hypothetical protein [Deltaproteobacteria bacterium]